MTRLYFMRMRRTALTAERITPELARARGEVVSIFMHFLDLPILFVIIALGAIQPATWALFFVGSLTAIAVATVMTVLIPRLYPCGSDTAPA